MTERAAPRALAGALAGLLLLSACGSSDTDKEAGRHPETPTPTVASSGPSTVATPQPSAAAKSGTANPGPVTTSSSTATRPAEPTAYSGTLTAVKDTTARLSSPAGTVTIAWGTGTVIVDAVDAKPADVAVGSCVLVLPPSGGVAPTATTMTAAVVRLVASSPSCPPVPGASPAPGTEPTGGPGTGGSITLVGGPGVIGTVSAKSAKGFTLRSRSDAKVRTIAVTTNRDTVYRKAGEHPRTTVDVGRCATVWGKRSGSHIDATRIRLSDPDGGACPTDGVS